MTLIIGTHSFVAGDRKITADSGERCDNLKKVISNDVLIAGFAGDFETILEAIRLVEMGEVDPKVIAKTGVEGLVLKDERLYLLDCRKAWKRPKKEAFYACGTGATAALAFLSGRVSKIPGSKLTDKDVTDCFKFVAKSRDDCGSKFDRME